MYENYCIMFLVIVEDSFQVMLQRAPEDDMCGVTMVELNVLNQAARERVFSRTMDKRIGSLIVFAVQRAQQTGALA
jgi:hypothetical protein